jgi:thiol-disulfide isomerase/thioredoxin
MKNFVSNLAVFVVLVFALSSLTGCSGSSTTANSANIPNPPGKENPPKGDSGKASIYPPLAPSLAEAQIEMLDGSKSKISDHKGKALVLNLWAIWCGPCRDEMPHLAAMQKQYGDRVEVISLNVGDNNLNPEPIDSIRKFAADNKIDYTLGRSAQETTRQFYMLSKQSAIPQTVMVDSEGRLRGVFVGGGPPAFQSMQRTLDKIMSEG